MIRYAVFDKGTGDILRYCTASTLKSAHDEEGAAAGVLLCSDRVRDTTHRVDVTDPGGARTIRAKTASGGSPAAHLGGPGDIGPAGMGLCGAAAAQTE